MAALGMQLARISADAKKNPELAKGVQDAHRVGAEFVPRNTYNLLPSASTPAGGKRHFVSLSWYVQGLAERSSLEIDLRVPRTSEDSRPTWNSSYSDLFRKV